MAAQNANSTQTVQQCESVRDDSVSNTVANINFKPVCHFGVPQNNKKVKAHYINPGIRYRCVCRSFSNLFNSIYQIISSPGLCIITVIITCVTCGQLASDRYLRFARCVKKDPFFVVAGSTVSSTDQARISTVEIGGPPGLQHKCAT